MNGQDKTGESVSVLSLIFFFFFLLSELQEVGGKLSYNDTLSNFSNSALNYID